MLVDKNKKDLIKEMNFKIFAVYLAYREEYYDEDQDLWNYPKSEEQMLIEGWISSLYYVKSTKKYEFAFEELL